MSGPGPSIVIRLMAEQRKRCLATILNSAENSPWWSRLSENQQQYYRDQVRSSIGIFYEFCRDVAKVTDDDGVRNELALDLIRAIHSDQQHIKQRLEASDGTGA